MQFSLELKFFDRTVELAKTLPLTDWLEKSNIRPGKIETFLRCRVFLQEECDFICSSVLNVYCVYRSFATKKYNFPSYIKEDYLFT